MLFHYLFSFCMMWLQSCKWFWEGKNLSIGRDLSACAVLHLSRLTCLISACSCIIVHEMFTNTDDSIQLATFSDFVFLCSISLCASAAEGVLCRWNYLKVSKGDVT